MLMATWNILKKPVTLIHVDSHSDLGDTDTRISCYSKNYRAYVEKCLRIGNYIAPATGLPIGPTADNLAAAIAGETHEYTDMYPGMARTAREEGHDEIADWFETLAKAERSHANRFQKALNELD